MCIELANKSIQYLRGITENVIVKIDKFVFPVDFVVLYMEEDFRVPIALGRPFLANAHAMINVFDKKISFEVRNEKITFDIEKSMKFSTSCDDTYSFLFEPIINHQPSKDVNLWEEENEITMDEEKPRHGLDLSVTLNPKMQDVVKSKIVKLRDAGLIYDISDSPWISPIHVVPKKGGMTVISNEKNKLVPTRTVAGWRVCIDYRKLNDATRKDHFPLPFIDQMFERLSVMSKTVVYTYHSALKYFFNKQYAKPRIIRLENPKLEELDEEAIRDSFPDEHLMAIHVKEPEKDPWFLQPRNGSSQSSWLIDMLKTIVADINNDIVC
ncbi:reverse transcriptase domain-containing protein [Tanacetum coccineum]